MRSGTRLAAAAAAIAAALPLAAAGTAGAQSPPNPIDCAGPIPDAEPGTAAYLVRDANNMYCAVQRHIDQALHPVTPLPLSGESFGIAPIALTDAYREPSRHQGKRFRFERLAITNRNGERLTAELYRPCAPGTCDLPTPLTSAAPPYPGVVVLHGGGSRKELHWWSSQTLAEAGYMVVAFNGAAGNLDNAADVLDWLLATPARPTPAGEHNPHWQELDRDRIGLAGHSMGGQAASVLGQIDERVDAIVSWDRGTGIQLPDDLDTPTLFFVADYACQANPVCLPEPYLEPPRGEGPGERGREYEVVRAAGVDAMKLALRATAHLDWTPSEPAGNRYGEIVSVYHTLAWFDLYLKGADDPAEARQAFLRLIATRFDDYADIHNISQGLFDPVRFAQNPTDLYAGNVPYSIDGMPVADRLSFYFRSKCSLWAPAAVGGGRYFSDDMRAEGCPRVAAGGRGGLGQPGSEGDQGRGDCANVIRGTGERDRLRGTSGPDRIRGRRGSDRLWGRRGDDCLHGGKGPDRLAGGLGRDLLQGGPGRDRILGGRGGDLIRAAGGGRDLIACGPGRDRALVDRRDRVRRGCERISLRG